MTVLEAITKRHSVRAYTERPIEDDKRDQLEAVLAEINQDSGLNITIVYDDPNGFDSKLAHYGQFRNVYNYIVLKGKDRENFEETCGYYGEKLVLQAQMMGLNTCWVALTFNKKQVKTMIPEGERFCMVIALGYGQTQGKVRRSKSVESVVATKGKMPDWFAAGVRAALQAPTAMNQQKFKIGMIGDQPGIRVSGKGFYTYVDLGIVKYHFEVASGREVV